MWTGCELFEIFRLVRKTLWFCIKLYFIIVQSFLYKEILLQSSPIQTFFNSEYKGTNHVFLTAEPVSECTNDINHINLNKYVCKIWVKRLKE